MNDVNKDGWKTSAGSTVTAQRVAAASRRIEAKVTTLPLGQYGVRGVKGVFTSKAEAIAMAKRLDVPNSRER